MRPLSNQQRLHLVNTEQLYQNYAEAQRHDDSFRYGMRWKTVRGVDYLFRPHNRRGDGRSLGRRDDRTESIHREFNAGKLRSEERLAAIKQSLDEQARLNKALRINRVPGVVAAILRELAHAGAMPDFTVIGTQALFAYESLGGVQFLLELLASGDVDLLYDHRKRLTVTSQKFDGNGLIGLLKRVDKTFVPIRANGFRAANAGQFMVDLIVPPLDMRTPHVQFAERDLVASEVPGLQWLLSSPKYTTVAVDENGLPAPFRVTDPRAFAIHKFWLSQRPEREPIKKPRDAAQARAVAQLVNETLPHLPFEAEHLRFFPRQVLQQGLGLVG